MKAIRRWPCGHQHVAADPDRLDVVGQYRVGARVLDLAVAGDDGDPEVQQPCDLLAARIRRRDDHAENALVDQRLEVRALLLRGLVGVADQHAVAGFEGLVLDRADQLAEVRVLDVGHDDADGGGALAPQVAGEDVGPVVELLDRALHARPVRLADARIAVQHARDGGGRDRGVASHVGDRQSWVAEKPFSDHARKAVYSFAQIRESDFWEPISEITVAHVHQPRHALSCGSRGSEAPC